MAGTVSATPHFDVAVVGAGPAGSATAVAARRRGLSVLLVDQATFPRRKVCGCCLNAHATSALTALGLGGLLRELGAVPLPRVELAARGRRATLLQTGSFGLSREAFDVALIRAAVAAGTEFHPGVKVPTPARVGNRWHLEVGQPVTATTLVDATGLNGRFLNPEPVVAPSARIGAGAVFAADTPHYPPGTVTLGVGRGGYVGLVRLEDGRLDAAAAFDAGHVRASGSLAAAAAAVLIEAGLPALPDGAWKGTPPLTRRAAAIAGPGWFAVGDAAGYVEPFTGEGMAWAVAGAATLAPLLTVPDAAALWHAAYRANVAARQGPCRAIAALLRRPAVCGVAVRVLRYWPAVAAPVVRRLNRPLLPRRGL
jgi:flavin-dependent dehydrogenase